MRNELNWGGGGGGGGMSKSGGDESRLLNLWGGMSENVGGGIELTVGGMGMS